MRLAELQRAFARRVLEGDDAILDHIQDSRREKRAVLMHVYEHAYGARLAEILEGDYEKLHQALGADAFLEAAAAYVAAEPSRNQNARYFGKRLPGFLAETAPWSARPWLAELANLEWAMGEVFVAEDPPRLAMEAMAALHPQDWPLLRFQMTDDVRRLTSSHGGPEAWLALMEGEDLAAAAAEAAGETTEWLIWRQDEQAHFRAFELEEAWAFDQARAGLRFDALCEGMVEWTAPEQAATLVAGYLRGWILAGVVAGYDVVPDDDEAGDA